MSSSRPAFPRRTTYLPRVVGVVLGVLLAGAYCLDAPASADVGVTSSSSAPPPYELHCGQEWRGNDGTFDFGIRFQCLPTRGVLNWDVRFASPLKERVQYPVQEKGLKWWADGVLGGDANGHREGPDYRFHGTMNPVFVNQEIEYQDFFTFKTDVEGSAGTSAAVFGGTIILRA